MEESEVHSLALLPGYLEGREEQLAPAATCGQVSLGHSRGSTRFSAPGCCVSYFSPIRDHMPSKMQGKEGC